MTTWNGNYNSLRNLALQPLDDRWDTGQVEFQTPNVQHSGCSGVVRPD
jgi:hypothetical protein